MDARFTTITLRDMRFDASVGILDSERTATQPIHVDLEVRVPGDGVVDYRALYDATAAVLAAGHIDYLEEIADRVIARALAASPQIGAVRVAVRKPKVQLGGPLAYAEVARSVRASRGTMDVAYLALGSNLGDRAEHLAWARGAIAAGLPQTRVVAESEIEETEAIGPGHQKPYLNQIVAIETVLTPRQLLRYTQRFESLRGRVRGERWGARTLDIDIVCYDGTTASEPGLVVPHAELPNRDFWHRELADVRAKLRDRSQA